MLVALELDNLGMPLVFEWLLERMKVQCAEAARECFLPIAGEVLVPEEENLILEEGRANFDEGGITELRHRPQRPTLQQQDSP